MDSIGDYLYIIVFVVIIVVNILKNLRKQKPVVVTPDPPGNYSESKKEDEDDDFWRSLSSPSQQPVVQVQQVQNIQQIQNKRKDVKTILPKNELKKKSAVLEEKEESNSFSVAFNDKDDARRAFIYSEIWNRKY